MDIFDINNGQKTKELKQFMEILDAIVSNHEQQIKDLAAHLLELRQLVTPMMEFKQPTKICGPNLEETLNAAGFYRKKEWVYLTEQDVATIKKNAITMEWAILMADTTAKEKNHMTKKHRQEALAQEAREKVRKPLTEDDDLDNVRYKAKYRYETKQPLTEGEISETCDTWIIDSIGIEEVIFIVRRTERAHGIGVKDE